MHGFLRHLVGKALLIRTSQREGGGGETYEVLSGKLGHIQGSPHFKSLEYGGIPLLYAVLMTLFITSYQPAAADCMDSCTMEHKHTIINK